MKNKSIRGYECPEILRISPSRKFDDLVVKSNDIIATG